MGGWDGKGDSVGLMIGNQEEVEIVSSHKIL